MNLVLKTLQELKRHLTADEVYEFIKKEHPMIGRGTVYRNLKILVEEGAIRKVEVPDGSDRFDFTLKDHYPIKCVKCGDIFDVDMEQLPDLKAKIRDTHGMEFLGYDIFFKGICPACRATEG
ncbi:MAG: transcriptional repressor [Clostridium sp.]|nr:transcriptional repressor [Clostridium sp.]